VGEEMLRWRQSATIGDRLAPLCGAAILFRQASRKTGMPMLRRLYDWTLSLAARKSAEWWLAFIAFIESSIFLVPADVLFLPMALSRPDRTYRYALIATTASVAGGIAGWFLGHYAYETIAKPVLEFYGKLDEFEVLSASGGTGFILLMLVTSGLAHLPPIKVVTILSGVIGVDIWVFIISAIIARGARFYFLAWLLKTYGEPIREFIEKRLGLIAGLGAVALISLYLAVRYFH
jgi:membrane protein YqaA with SNARE-associated domain